jgi:hypothetical protein
MHFRILALCSQFDLCTTIIASDDDLEKKIKKLVAQRCSQADRLSCQAIQQPLCFSALTLTTVKLVHFYLLEVWTGMAFSAK